MKTLIPVSFITIFLVMALLPVQAADVADKGLILYFVILNFVKKLRFCCGFCNFVLKV